ncbi:type II toxin-antitoxin system HicB family antitoxin [Candidatus Parcubacteria bacterium]|nr:type II toxin-antitoxin system HicB family antitoxin [Candidatus Parcubacteria bacterium]
MLKQNKKSYNFPVIIEKDEQGYFIGNVPSLRSCYTQAKTLPELYKRLQEVVALCLEVERDIFKKPIEQNRFIGVQELEFAS